MHARIRFPAGNPPGRAHEVAGSTGSSISDSISTDRVDVKPTKLRLTTPKQQEEPLDSDDFRCIHKTPYGSEVGCAINHISRYENAAVPEKQGVSAPRRSGPCDGSNETADGGSGSEPSRWQRCSQAGSRKLETRIVDDESLPSYLVVKIAVELIAEYHYTRVPPLTT